jgi:hypothetical protein
MPHYPRRVSRDSRSWRTGTQSALSGPHFRNATDASLAPGSGRPPGGGTSAAGGGCFLRRAAGPTVLSPPCCQPTRPLRRPVRAARFVGHGPGDRHGPVSAPEDRPAAAAALGEAVAGGLWGCRVFFAEKLDASTWAPLIGGRVLRREVSPVLRTEGRTWEDFLASVGLSEPPRADESARKKAVPRP